MNTLSDVEKRTRWDDSVKAVEIFQNFATNGFIYHTTMKKISKITPEEDYVEKRVWKSVYWFRLFSIYQKKIKSS